jgi:hypothetical protein
VATAKGKFDTTNQTIEALAAKLMFINRQLVKFGPEANDARELLRKYTIARIAATWPDEAGPKPAPDNPPPWKWLESLQQSLSGLTLKTEAQRSEAAAASESGNRSRKDDVARDGASSFARSAALRRDPH